MKKEEQKDHFASKHISTISTKASQQNQPESSRYFDTTSINNLEQLSITSIPNSRNSKKIVSGEYEPPGKQSSNNEHIIPLNLKDSIYFQEDIIYVFEKISQEMGLTIIQKQARYASAIKKHKPGKQKVKWMVDYINCLNWWQDMKTTKNTANITAVKINIYDHSRVEDVKLCRIKYLGKSCEQLTNSFTEKFKKGLDSMKIIHKEPIHINTSQSDQNIQEANKNPYHLEACAHYILHKILSSPQQQEKIIVQKMEKSLGEFYQSFQNIKQSSESLPTPMINAMQLSKQLASSIHKYLKNQSIQEQTDFLSPYLTICIQQYIFRKINTLMNQIYLHHCYQNTIAFDNKVQLIKNSISVNQIFEEVLIDKKLRMIEKKFEDKLYDKNCRWEQKRDGITFVKLAYPLINANNLHKIASIREKIKSCQIMYAQVKSLFFEHLNRKYQLSSMEDIIPVFIIIILFCGDSQQKSDKNSRASIRAELDMMIDYINASGEQFEAEKRLLINLSQSFNYIVRDWIIQ